MRSGSAGALAAGTSSVAARMVATGKGVWQVGLDVDGVERATVADVPLLYGIAPFEGIDVGIDRRSPVSWELYERFGPFAYEGTLHAVTFVPGADAPDSPGNLLDVIRSMGARFE
jgi:arylsulfatase